MALALIWQCRRLARCAGLGLPSVSKPFCGDCDRVRITADGQFRTCLFATTEFDLRKLLREGAIGPAGKLASFCTIDARRRAQVEENQDEARPLDLQNRDGRRKGGCQLVPEESTIKNDLMS